MTVTASPGSNAVAAHNGTEFSLNDPTHTFVVRALGKATLVGDILRVESDPAQTGRLFVVQDLNGNEVLVVNADGTVTLKQSVLTLTAMNIATDATTGMKIGTATTQKVALHNATPVVQRAGAAQAAVVATGASNSSPYGFTTAAQADAIVTLVNELRAALVEKGIIKGAA